MEGSNVMIPPYRRYFASGRFRLGRWCDIIVSLGGCSLYEGGKEGKRKKDKEGGGEGGRRSTDLS